MSDCCNDKACEIEALKAKQSSTLKAVLGINATMFGVEIAAGIAAGSVALVADSLDMLGDALVYGFSLYAVTRGLREKAISALLKGGIMAAFGLTVLVQALYKALHPETPVVEVIGIVGVAALIANGSCLALLWRHRADDINMHSVWLCSRNDIIANVSVLIAAVGVWTLHSGWPDILVGTALAALFLRSSVQVIRDALKALRTAPPAASAAALSLGCLRGHAADAALKEASASGRRPTADMKILVTGSAGHLGEALMRTLRATDHTAIGLDITASPFTTIVGSIADRAAVERAMRGVDAVLHTATLHKPHVATHSAQAFVETNVSGTLALLEAAVTNEVRTFVFTSTTSAFGDALVPASGEPAAWIIESTTPIPKNIYGVTKTAAEDLCALFHRDHRLPCVILRTSRFFPEDDDHAETRRAYDPVNLKVNEYLYRRVDIEDAVSAHLLALERAPTIGFGRYIISATTPFARDDTVALRIDAPSVLAMRVPGYQAEYERRGWRMFPSIDRVYVNERARTELNWRPRYDFEYILDRLRADEDPRSSLARSVGYKGYHPQG